MTPVRVVTVMGANGIRGHIDTTTSPLDGSQPEVLVQLDDGRQALVPLEALHRQEDGSYALHLDPGELEARQGTGSHGSGRPLVVPVMAEALEIDKRRVEMGRVRINKIVHEREEVIDQPLLSEEVSIERVPIHRFVDETIPIRYEGDTMIISLLEEVPVVKKRLMLKEELRITKRQVEAHRAVRVTLRREEATVEHLDVEVEPRAPTKTATEERGFEAYDADFRGHYRTSLASRGHAYDHWAPAYRYGYELANDQRYAGSDWTVIEPEARGHWEEGHQGTWEEFKDTIRYAWETVRGRR
jgi:uncharacterized protein (TIGR02271 family)